VLTHVTKNPDEAQGQGARPQLGSIAIHEKESSQRRGKRMKRESLATCVGACLLALLPRTVVAIPPRYSVTDLGTLPGGHESVALGINNAGQVVGYNVNYPPGPVVRPVLWEPDGAVRDLGDLGGDEGGCVNAADINSYGQVVGESRSTTGYRAFLWDPANGIRDLGDLPGGFDSSQANAINDTGHVVGTSGAQTGYRAFLWDAVNGMRDLGDLPGGEDISYANAINNHAQVAGQSKTATGWRAVLWDDHGMQNLGELPGGENTSIAFDLNDTGQVVGFSDATTGWRAFLWDADVGMRDLGDLPGGRDLSIARAINNRGQIVGDSDGHVGTRVFLWDAENGMQSIEDLVDASASGWEFIFGWDVNDLGHIVGYGRNPHGDYRAFLLVPEPGPLSLLALGGLALIGHRRK